MNAASQFAFREPIALNVHFDVSEHWLDLQSYIETTSSVKQIFEAFALISLGSGVSYQAVVLPPEEGSFLARIGIIGGLFVGGVHLLDTDIASAFVEEFSGQTPEEWSRAAGRAARELLDFEDNKEIEDDPRVKCAIGAQISVQLAEKLLQDQIVDLDDYLAISKPLNGALNGKSEFYTACALDRRIQGIGFTTKDDFPIRRSHFPELARPRKLVSDDPDKWEVEITSVRISSPNWDKSDQKVRKWKGKDITGRISFFTIEDEEFWFRARQEELDVQILDEMTVQWAYQMNNGRRIKVRVLRVLKHNDESLASPLSSDALSAKLGDFSSAEVSAQTDSLF